MASAWALTAPLIAVGALPSRLWAALAAWEMSDFVGLSCSPANLTLIVWSWLQKSAAELPPPPPQALIVAAVPAAASRSMALRQFRMMVIMVGPSFRCSAPRSTQCSWPPWSCRWWSHSSPSPVDPRGAERHVELDRAVGGPRDDIGRCGDTRRRDAAGGRRQGRRGPGRGWL